MYRILVVEDDAVIAKGVCECLCTWGYDARAATNFSDILSEFAETEPQLVLMDISLPFYNGYYWCSRIRAISPVPIVFLSSAADNMNIVMAMNMGGDDFIAKPFDLSVLSAKVQAMLRRSYDYQGQSQLTQYRGIVFNRADGTITNGENKISLSKNEAKIFDTLLSARGTIVSRETLMNALWACDAYVDENTLSVNVTRLRHRLAQIGAEEVIETKKGQGYLIEQ